MKREKKRYEMKKIEEKYGSELLSEVRKDMGLPTLLVPNLNLSQSSSQNPIPSFLPYGNNPSFNLWQVFIAAGITPSGLLTKVKERNITEVSYRILTIHTKHQKQVYMETIGHWIVVVIPQHLQSDLQTKKTVSTC